eukprot:Nk52_evm30s805 gene=Nk52_evmTU30s805
MDGNYYQSSHTEASTIADLSPLGFGEQNLRCIVIKRNSPRSFQDRNGKWSIAGNNSPDQEVQCTFITVRDIKSEIINVQFWGSPEYIEMISSACQLGNVVNIHNPQVSVCTDKIRNYMPTTDSTCVLSEAILVHLSFQSPFKLTIPYFFTFKNDRQYYLRLSEKNQTINGSRLELDVQMRDIFHHQLKIPFQVCGGYTALGNIITFEQNVFINALVMIKKCHDKKTITTRNGNCTEKKTFSVLDFSCDHITLTVWEDSLQNTEHWEKGMILQLVDVKVRGGQYPALTYNCKTLCIENPSDPGAQSLYEHGTQILEKSKNAIEWSEDAIATIKEGITNEMFLKQAIDTLNVKGSVTFFTLANITMFDIDSPCFSQSPIVAKCQTCKSRSPLQLDVVSGNLIPLTSCPDSNEDCLLNHKSTVNHLYNVSFEIADSTESLTAKLNDAVAFSLFGSTENLIQTTFAERASLKQALLFEKYRFYVHAEKMKNGRVTATILKIEPPTYQEVLNSDKQVCSTFLATM